MDQLIFVAGDNCSVSDEVAPKVDLFESMYPDVVVHRLHTGQDEDRFAELTNGEKLNRTPTLIAIRDDVVIDRHEAYGCENKMGQMFGYVEPTNPDSAAPMDGTNLESSVETIDADGTGIDKLLFLWGDWCEYCKNMNPLVAKFQADHMDINVIPIDVVNDQDKVRDECMGIEISSVPMFLGFKENKLKYKHQGVLTAAELEALTTL